MESSSPPPALKLVVEALLFAAQKALSAKEIREFLSLAAQDETASEAAAFKKVREEDIRAALDELEMDHAASDRSFRLSCVADAWQFTARPEYAPWMRVLLGRKPRPPRLSQPALETLTIIAYRQPATRAEIEQIRGVSVDGVMQTLLERGLIEAVGRAEAVGRPVTYGTTRLFLEYFGLKSIVDLPEADELRRLPVQRPEALLTVDPGLATAPPEQLRQTGELPGDPAVEHRPDNANLAPEVNPPAGEAHTD